MNDVHGHDIGDVVLKETANVLKPLSRQGEEPARLGGEEFLVICPNSTLAQAQACASVPGLPSKATRSAAARSTVTSRRASACASERAR